MKKKNPKTKVGARDLGIAVIGLNLFLFEEIWILVLWVTKALPYFKPCLIGHTCRSTEEHAAENDLICEDWFKRYQRIKF